MAQVIRTHKSKAVITHNLDRLLAFWRTVPEQAAEWPEWDRYSQLDFITEWTTERDMLMRVSAAADAGVLDKRQCRKWSELQQLVETHRATVEWMLEGPI